MLKVEVAFTPRLYSLYENPDSIVVVIDILRASSAICTAFEHGAKKVIPVAEVETAREFQRKGLLVGAERNGEKIPGFDFGNSPFDYMVDAVKDNTLALTTTNGTKAIHMIKEAHAVVIGAFTNMTALCNWLVEQGRDVILLCAGWRDKYNLEDSLFAGAVADELSKHMIEVELSDSALASKYLYHLAKDDPYLFLRNSSHRRRLKKLNLKEDVRYCFTLDQTQVIPILHDGALIRYTSDEMAPVYSFSRDSKAH